MVLKIDSTKKVTRKLQGVEADSANWVTNVGNERAEIVISVLKASESTSSLKPMADGLVNRFAAAKVEPPQILYTDKDYSGSQDQSRFNSLFSSWPNKVVRLDIFYFMQHLAAGYKSESHPLYGMFTGGLDRCVFQWDANDLTLLNSAKREELRRAGVANPSDKAVKKALTKDEMARHCQSRTRGVAETSRLMEELMSSKSGATDALGVPLFREDKLFIVPNSSSGVSKICNSMETQKWKFEEERKAAAKAEGLPTPPKKRMVYTCKKCQRPQTKETSNSKFFGQTYCPNEPGQIPKEEWLGKKAAERKANKASTG
ncbi:uncharacterized protein LOC144652946 isoform X2 [Oculina patagonica]